MSKRDITQTILIAAFFFFAAFAVGLCGGCTTGGPGEPVDPDAGMAVDAAPPTCASVGCTGGSLECTRAGRCECPQPDGGTAACVDPRPDGGGF